MIISRTPYRISFFGGGTDFPAWYRQHGEAALFRQDDEIVSCNANRIHYKDYRKSSL